MRVLMVIPVLDPATGGPPGIAVAQAVGLGRLGVEVEVAAYDGWEGDAAAATRAGEMIRSAVARGEEGGTGRLVVRSLGVLSRGEAVWCGRARGVLRELVRGFDVVHLHGVWDPLVMWAAREARRARGVGGGGVPYVVSSHGMLESWALRKRWKKELFWVAGWGRMLRCAAAIHDHKDGPLSVLGRELEVPVWNIPNGIWAGGESARESTDAAWEGLCLRFPVLKGKRVVLFLGRLAEQKAPEVLVEGFGRVAEQLGEDVVLLMAGPDYGLEREVRRRLEGQAWGRRVVVSGGLFGEEKAAALAKAEVFALPSRHEGFSVAVLEAMGCGKACLLTPACHFSRAGEVGAAEIVNSDPAEVGAGLVRVLTTPGLIGQMGARARELVEREYMWAAVARQLKAMYEAVGGRRDVGGER